MQTESLHQLISHDALSASVTLLSILVGWAIREYRSDRKSRTATRVKANLSFDDLVERKPEMQRHYDALMETSMEHGWGRR